MWKHYFSGKQYPLWLEGDGVESLGYSEQLRHLRRAIESGIPIVGFLVEANDPQGRNPTVREAYTDRLFKLDIMTDTSERIVGRIAGLAEDDA